MSAASSEWARYLGWGASALTLLVLGPIAFAVVMLDSRPGGTGADPAAKLFVAALVLGIAALAGLAVRGLVLLAAYLLGKRKVDG